MLQSKLVQYLTKLSKKEKEKFRLFVDSPYYNQHQKTKELLQILLDQLINQPQNNIDREKLYAMLYPQESYNEQQLHNVMSYLKKLFHRFLAIRQFEQEELSESFYTVQQAFRSNQFDLMTNRAKQLEKKLEKATRHDSSHHYISYRLNHVMGYYHSDHIDRSTTNIFQRMLDSLDRFFIIEKLRNCCHLQANTMVINSQYDFGMFEEIAQYLDSRPELLEDEPSINLYRTIYLTLSEEQNPKYYEQLKEIFYDNPLRKLSTKEVKDLFGFATNYCIRQINMGKSVYQRELFELYKEGVNQNLLAENNIISEWVYKNIVTLGCKLKEFEWTEHFIEGHKDNIPLSKKENAYNFNMGMLLYSKKQYNEAIQKLLHVQFTDPKYHLNTTFLLLRTYYALKDTEALLSLIDTFRVYVIRNKKITTGERKGYTNFLRFAKKLVLLKHQASTYTKKSLKEKVDALSQKISETDNVINKYWLMEECNV